MTDTDPRQAALDELLGDALAQQEIIDEGHAQLAREREQAAENKALLRETVERLTEERAAAVAEAEVACRAMIRAFSAVIDLNAELAPAVSALGESVALSSTELERRLSVVLAGQLASISRTTGPAFGGLRYRWSYPAHRAWPGDLVLTPVEKKDAEINLESDEPGRGGSRLQAHGSDVEGGPDASSGY